MPRTSLNLLGEEMVKKHSEVFSRRLKVLADHLFREKSGFCLSNPQIIFFILDFGERKVGFEAHYHSWALTDLPFLFREWFSPDEDSSPATKYDEDSLSGRPFTKCSTVKNACEFFNLSSEQFLHLFGVKGLQQIKRFGGLEYSSEVTPKHIAENIYAFIDMLDNPSYN